MDRAALTALIASFDRTLAAGDALLAVLEAERVALTGPDLAALEAVTADKERSAREFEDRDAQRRALLATHAVGPGRAEMIAFLRKVEDPAYSEASARPMPLALRWRRLVEMVGRLRDANERNGAIVSLRSRQVRRTLNVLRTGQPEELTYGRAGNTHASPASRALARA